MKNLHYILSSLVFVSILFTSCEKEYKDPTIRTVTEGTVISIAEVRALETPGMPYIVAEDISVYGVVTMDESTGNLYKESYITDATGNLYLRFIASSGLNTGDSIMVNLKGAKILRYNQMLQVDSLHPDNSINKIATQIFKTPELVTIDYLLTNLEQSQGKLVQIDNVWFVEKGLGKTFAYSSTQTAESRFLEDLGGKQIEVRTSGYANFANDTLPAGVGSFIGVVAQYNSGLQLLIRNPSELTLTGVAPTQVLNKDFEDQSITSGGWTVQYPTPNNLWTVATFSSNYYAYITNGSGKLVGESWLISPSIDFTNATSAAISFLTATFSANTNLEIYVSTNYDGISLPATATWTNLTSQANFSTGGWNWKSSGSINLTAYQQPNVFFAFKYKGTSVSWDSWEIDDIKVYK